MITPTDLNSVVARCGLAIHPDSLAIIAGSGVSVDHPSNAPTGIALSQFLLRQLFSGTPFHDAGRDLIFPKDFAVAGKSVILRFEHFISALRQTGFDYEMELLSITLGHLKPNSLHRSLASLIKNGTDVVTTNFDVAIESLLGRDSGEACLFPSFRHFPNEGLYFKAHGTLLEKDTSISTINIADTVHHIIHHSYHQQPFLADFAKILAEKALLIVGYSGMDDFDLVPFLINTQSSQPLIWVQHSGTTTRLLNYNDLLTQSQRSDGRMETKAEALLLALGLANTRPKHNIWLLQCNTRLLVEQLSSLPPSNEIVTSETADQKLGRVEVEYSQRPDLFRYACAQVALLEARADKLAHQFGQWLVQQPPDPANGVGRRVCLRNTAEAACRNLEFGEAIEHMTACASDLHLETVKTLGGELTHERLSAARSELLEQLEERLRSSGIAGRYLHFDGSTEAGKTLVMAQEWGRTLAVMAKSYSKSNRAHALQCYRSAIDLIRYFIIRGETEQGRVSFTPQYDMNYYFGMWFNVIILEVEMDLDLWQQWTVRLRRLARDAVQDRCIEVYWRAHYLLVELYLKRAKRKERARLFLARISRDAKVHAIVLEREV